MGWECCSLRVEGEETEEKEYLSYLSGSGIPIAFCGLFFLFISLVFSFFICLAWTSGLPLVPGTPKENPWLVPNEGGLFRRSFLL